MQSPRPKILTVQFKSLGDTVVSIPTLVAIRQRFPDCELHAVVPEASVPLLDHHPAVNRVWAVPRKDDPDKITTAPIPPEVIAKFG